MLARLDRLQDHPRTESGGGGQQDDVDVRILQHPLVAVEAAVDLRVLEGHLALVLGAKRLPQGGALGRVEIRRGHHLHVLIDRQRVVDGPGAPAAAAHDPELELARLGGHGP